MPEIFIICSNEDELKLHESRYGNHTFEISFEDIVAIFEGKTLTAMVNDEYGVFIKLADKNDNENKENHNC